MNKYLEQEEQLLVEEGQLLERLWLEQLLLERLWSVEEAQLLEQQSMVVLSL